MKKKLKQSVFSRLDEGEWSAPQSDRCTTVERVSYTNRRGIWMDLSVGHITVLSIPPNWL
jgi:hypothetical protein